MLVPPRNIARLLVAGLRDQLGAWLGRPPRLVAAAGDPGTLAAMTAPEAKPGCAALVGPNSKWRNEFAARLMLTFGFYRPGLKTKRLKMPLLMCVCDNDATTPVAPAVRPPNGHRGPNSATTRTVIFDIYHDPQVKADQVAFLHGTVQEVPA